MMLRKQLSMLLKREDGRYTFDEFLLGAAGYFTPNPEGIEGDLVVVLTCPIFHMENAWRIWT